MTPWPADDRDEFDAWVATLPAGERDERLANLTRIISAARRGDRDAAAWLRGEGRIVQVIRPGNVLEYVFSPWDGDADPAPWE